MKRKPLAAAIRDGDIAAQACDRCGGAGQPLVRRRDARTVEVVGWRCFACRHLPAGAYYVYVVELREGAGERAVYVGQSALFPAERLSQHLTGYKAAAVVRRFGSHLRPDLFRAFNPIPTRADAEAMEQRLAARLAARGYTVYGGH